MAGEPQAAPDDRGVFWESLDDFREALQTKNSASFSSKEVQGQASAIAQTYFRAIRPALVSLSLGNELAALDSAFQLLLKQANSRTARAEFKKTLSTIATLRPLLEVAIELEISRQFSSTGLLVTQLSPTEKAITETLEKLVPTAASSYRQSCSDLRDLRRISFRGTAADLRECVREVLDHLAPDGDVSSAPSFTLEQGRTKPTMKQKARFILKSRKVPDAARQSPEGMIDLLEDTAGLPRTIYDHGSLATHVSQARQGVAQYKRYADAVLCELLELTVF
jgi:Predicted pPIWI-associating nuclease